MLQLTYGNFIQSIFCSCQIDGPILLLTDNELKMYYVKVFMSTVIEFTTMVSPLLVILLIDIYTVSQKSFHL